MAGHAGAPHGVGELSPDALAERIAGRLHLAPRFRQVVVPAPLGEPLWVDDPEFALSRHLTVRELGDPKGLEQLASEFFSEQLDRSGPLWKISIVPRAGPGRAAVLGKIHHAMVDGIAAVELGTLLFDLAPTATPPDAVAWEPAAAESPLRLAVDAVADGAIEQFRAARRVVAMGLTPRRTMRVAETMRRAALSAAEDVIRPAPDSFLNAPITPRRTLVAESVPLSRLLQIKEAQGVKLNDVVLAAVAGALRRYAALADEEARPLRAMVPVNVRAPADSPAEGNRITFAFVDLPVDEPDAGRRLALVGEAHAGAQVIWTDRR